MAVLVEGNTDALMAHQQGFDNVIGSLGTALTAAQVELVTRYAPRIALAYDVDPAGQSAATFGATELTALVGEIERSRYQGRLTDVEMVRLPEGKDPDEVMRDDPAAWRKATEERQPIMEYLIDHHARRFDLRTPDGRSRLVRALVPILRTVSDPVRLDGYLLTLSRRSGVEAPALLETLRRPDPPSVGGARAGRRIDLDAVMSSPDALDPGAVERALEPVESTLLRLLLRHPELQADVRDRLRPEDLVTTPARELWRAIASVDGLFDRSRFLDGLDPTLGAIARTLYARTDPLPDRQADLELELEQCLLSLERRRLWERIDYTRAALAEAEATGDTNEADRLRRESLALHEARLDLDRRAAKTTLLDTRRTTPYRTPTHAGGPA